MGWLFKHSTTSGLVTALSLLCWLNMNGGCHHHPLLVSAAATPPPEQPQQLPMQLSGTMFQYHPEKYELVAIQAARTWPADTEPAGTLVLISGMGEGPLSMPVVPLLNRALTAARYHLVQVVLSSSYLGYGNGMLTRDVEELDKLLAKLYAMDDGHTHRNIALMGHSTGSQISLYYARTGRYRDRIKGAILQAAASDRDYQRTHVQGVDGAIKRAEAMLAAKQGDEMMRRADYPDAPITVERFLALLTRNGMDDMFSTDQTDEEVAKLYASVTVPLAMLQSGRDEYVPDQARLREMMQRHQRVYPRYRVSAVVPDAAHSPDTPDTQRKLVELVMQSLGKF